MLMTLTFYIIKIHLRKFHKIVMIFSIKNRLKMIFSLAFLLVEYFGNSHLTYYTNRQTNKCALKCTFCFNVKEFKSCSPNRQTDTTHTHTHTHTHMSQCEALAKGKPYGLMKNGGKPLVGGIKKAEDPSIL